jgi:hypothetical protein
MLALFCRLKPSTANIYIIYANIVSKSRDFRVFFENFGGSTALFPETIVKAALELLKRDGMENLTMYALAAFLDTRAASLYRHIKDKQDLYDLIAEAVPRLQKF